MGLRPDLVLCSTAVRARQTLDLVLAEFGAPPPRVNFEDGLYMATSGKLIARLHAVARDEAGALPHTVMMVGHNPGMEELATRLVGTGAADDTARMSAKFPTAAVAVIAFSADDWAALVPGDGRLEHFLTPKRLA
jgi:phosphohistidine phosphatase